MTLICFLLLSATYVNLVGMDAKVPIAVPGSSARADEQPRFKLELTVKANGVEVEATGAGRASGKRFLANAGGKPDFAAVHAALMQVKAERPREFSVYFNANVDMPYEQLVQFMDTTRNLSAKEATGTLAKLDTLFPDFIVAGLAAMPSQ